MSSNDPQKTISANRPNQTSAGAPAPTYEPGFAPTSSLPSTSPRQTSQAERAVMHPEHHDLDWRYYHAAGVG
jgi:hypothetical protein